MSLPEDGQRIPGQSGQNCQITDRGSIGKTSMECSKSSICIRAIWIISAMHRDAVILQIVLRGRWTPLNHSTLSFTSVKLVCCRATDSIIVLLNQIMVALFDSVPISLAHLIQDGNRRVRCALPQTHRMGFGKPMEAWEIGICQSIAN